MKTKERLDSILLRRGMADSIENARSLVMTGAVSSGGVRVDKPGTLLSPEAPIEVKPRTGGPAGRGSEKLKGAIEAFAIDPAGKVALDVGSSTGGFTDLLLRLGAERVYSVDVGRGLLDWKLRNDPRVISIEGINARHLEAGMLGCLVDLAVMDVSFISLELVLPPVMKLVKPGGDMIALVKPQFEAEKGAVGPGGVVRDDAVRKGAVDKISRFAATIGLELAGTVESPLKGRRGNREYFLHLKTGPDEKGKP